MSFCVGSSKEKIGTNPRHGIAHSFFRRSWTFWWLGSWVPVRTDTMCSRRMKPDAGKQGGVIAAVVSSCCLCTFGFKPTVLTRKITLGSVGTSVIWVKNCRLKGAASLFPGGIISIPILESHGELRPGASDMGAGLYSGGWGRARACLGMPGHAA